MRPAKRAQTLSVSTRASHRNRLLVGVVLVASCTPDKAPPKPARPHPQFPITEGKHAGFQCLACHPLTVTNYAQFECTGCHDKAATDPRHPAVNGYVWASGACFGCHRDGKSPNAPNISPDVHDPSQNVNVTALVPTFSGTRVDALTPLVQSIPMRMNHNASGIPAAALSSCTNCHLSADQGSLFPGQFHAALIGLGLDQPKACADCHAGAGPIGLLPRDAGVPWMRHDAVAWDAGERSGGLLLGEKCGLCHEPPTASSAAPWANPLPLHAVLADAGAPKGGSCIDCHVLRRPGLISWLDAGLPPKVEIDHSAAIWLGDCQSCHFSATTWAGGKFHRPGVPSPATCLPCHKDDRPTGPDPTPSGPPFDFATNANGITHGAGQDCVVCHSTGGRFDGGLFVHDAGALSGTTCVACHTTQRPTAPVNGFDHALSGTGDCFGCHQATGAHAAYPGDWAGGERYPGVHLIGSSDRFVQVNQIALRRGGDAGLVVGTTTTLATLYNAMLHTSLALSADAGLAPGPAPGLAATCWHCHTSTPGTTNVTAFRDGKFHSSLSSYRVGPLLGPTPLPQPTSGCTDCHAGMRPKNIVQKSTLQPMDHDARFTDGGSVSLLDCSSCHTDPGGVWNTGTFHENVAFADQQQLADCVGCHYTLMADSAKVDVISTATPSYRMQHRSGQLTFQQCDRCHPSALGNAQFGTTGAGLWAPGKFHQNLPAGKQPTACIECHGGVTTPNHPTQSAFLAKGSPQWMNHFVASVAARDCAFCHAASPTGNTWAKDTVLHRPGFAVTDCKGCHASTYQGLPSNIPPGLEPTSVVTGASAATGVAGTKIDIAHSDVNVAARDCGFCHSAPPDAGWPGATFHAKFQGSAALQLNGTSGRCSNCHANLTPLPSFPGQSHSAFTATSPTDCSACHLWPGTGSAAAPNWKRAAGPPTNISVGGFAIASPPAANTTTLHAGLNNLPHPAVPSGTQCTACHTQASGGRRAFGHDHALAPASWCAACHEAGSDLVGTPWVNNAPGANSATAQCGQGGGTVLDRGGNTRPIGIAQLACSSNAKTLTCGGQNCSLNHFFPADCGECHVKPSQTTPAVNTVGGPFVAAWRFTHFFGAPAQQATCCMCHAPPSCRP